MSCCVSLRLPPFSLRRFRLGPAPRRRTIRASPCASSCRSAPAARPMSMRGCSRSTFSDALKQPFVVENRPGAGAIIGTDAVAKSAPDGYTLLLMSNTHTTNESLIPNKPFQLMRDFVPVVADQLFRSADGRASVSRRRRTCRNSSRWRSPSRASSTTPRPARARRITWPANCSKR